MTGGYWLAFKNICVSHFKCFLEAQTFTYTVFFARKISKVALNWLHSHKEKRALLDYLRFGYFTFEERKNECFSSALTENK